MVDEAESLGGRSVDHIAGEDHLHRTAFADEIREPLRAAAAGNDAEVDLRLRKARPVARNANIARHRKFVAAAETEAVDHRDHRFWELIDRIEEVPLVEEVALRDGRIAFKLGNIGA